MNLCLCLVEVAGRPLPIRKHNPPSLQRGADGGGGGVVGDGLAVLDFRERGPGDAGGLGELLLAEAQERACLPDLTGRDPHFC